MSALFITVFSIEVGEYLPLQHFVLMVYFLLNVHWEHAVDGDKFTDYVRGSLILNMLPFDGTNSRSIAILDNCLVHHVESAVDLFHEAGILVLWLPQYSPDFNPAENAFSKVKYYLKERDEIENHAKIL